MNGEELRSYILGFKEAEETFPFDAETHVFKVAGKMFALMPHHLSSVSLKCNPDRALALRDAYDSVQPGYHLNKRHWNTITLGEDMPIDELRDLVHHSYELVVRGLKRSDRERLLGSSS